MSGIAETPGARGLRWRTQVPFTVRCSMLVLLWEVASALGQSGGGYIITKSTIDSGGGTATGGAYMMSGTLGQHDVGDLAGGEYLLFGGFWAPMDVAGPGTPDPVMAESPAIAKVRHISFLVPATSAATDTALRVELTSLHHPSSPPPGTPDFTAFEGQFRYLNSFGGSTTCVDSATFATTFRCGTLGCQPEYRDWATELSSATNPASAAGLIHVTGDSVVPSSTFNVSHIAASCGAAPGANACAAASAPLAVSTSRWGDVAGSGGGPPDGIQNVIDIGSVVDNVKGIPTAIPEHRAWMKNPPNVFGNPVNVIDIGLTVDSVKGFPYPYTIAACP